jgi:hypothetical protein
VFSCCFLTFFVFRCFCAAASASKAKDQSATFEGRASPGGGVVVWAGPKHCVSEGAGTEQMVSLQECAAALLNATDVKVTLMCLLLCCC